MRPCPRPGGAPGTGPGSRRSVGEDLLPRATATIQAARGNVRHRVFTSSAAHPGNGFWVWVWCGLALVFMWVWSGLVPGFMWAWSGLVLGVVWARCGFSVGFVSMWSARGLGSVWADRSVWAWCGFGAHMLSAVPVACVWCGSGVGLVSVRDVRIAARHWNSTMCAKSHNQPRSRTSGPGQNARRTKFSL